MPDASPAALVRLINPPALRARPPSNIFPTGTTTGFQADCQSGMPTYVGHAALAHQHLGLQSA